MKNSLEIYIVCHSTSSYRKFKELNIGKDFIEDFKIIFVGQDDFSIYEGNPKYIIARNLPYNIESTPTLLTFTAWFALSENELIQSDYVGIFEYDCVFTANPNRVDRDLKFEHIIGFNPMDTKDYRYLDCVPRFTGMLVQEESWIKESLARDMWNATTNIIMHRSFLFLFVCWYLDLIYHGLTEIDKHQHFHERAYNIFAAHHRFQIRFHKGVKHKMLRSHGVKLIDNVKRKRQTP